MLRAVCILLCAWICLASGFLFPEDSEQHEQGNCDILRNEVTKPVSEYMPTCTPDGSFAPQQCHGGTGYCWCSEPDGTEVPDTRVRLYSSNDCGGGSEKCDQLLPAAGELLDYLSEVLKHVINETDLLDGIAPEFVLQILRQAPEVQLPYLLTNRNFYETRDRICAVADAKSFVELGKVLARPKLPYLVPSPADRKKYVERAIDLSWLMKEWLGDFTDALESSGYPTFPLQIQKEPFNRAHEGLLRIAKAVYDHLKPDVEIATWSNFTNMEHKYFKALLEAQSLESFVALTEDILDPKTTDFLFDVVENRDMYLNIFDVLIHMMRTVEDIGILDLPVGELEFNKTNLH